MKIVTIPEQVDVDFKDETCGMFGRNLIFLEECDSTNDEAKRLIDRETPSGTVIVAEYQTKGRGRLDRTWHSQRGLNLLASIILYPDSHADRMFGYVTALSLAIADAIEDTTHLPVETKWPNDLLIHGKKIAGILPESALIGNKISHLILGFGINVLEDFSQMQELSPNTTSLKHEGSPIKIAILLKQVLSFLNSHLNMEPVHLHKRWLEKMILNDKNVSVRKGSRILMGRVETVLETGELLLNRDGRQEIVSFGDISLVK